MLFLLHDDLRKGKKGRGEGEGKGDTRGKTSSFLISRPEEGGGRKIEDQTQRMPLVELARSGREEEKRKGTRKAKRWQSSSPSLPRKREREESGGEKLGGLSILYFAGEKRGKKGNTLGRKRGKDSGPYILLSPLKK